MGLHVGVGIRVHMQGGQRCDGSAAGGVTGSGGPPSKGAENHARVPGRIASAIATKTSLQPQPRKVLLLQTMLG